jgi:hypothetical protein
MGDEARKALGKSARPVCFNSSPVIVNVPTAGGTSLTPACSCGGDAAVAQPDRATTTTKNNNFMANTPFVQLLHDLPMQL